VWGVKKLVVADVGGRAVQKSVQPFFMPDF